MLSHTLLFLHVVSVALWLGAAVFVSGDIRRTLSLGPPHLVPMLARARSGLRLDLIAGIAALATGLVLASPLGGTRLRAGIFIGLGLALVRFALLLAVSRPTLGRIAAAVEAGRGADATAGARRLSAVQGVSHLLWILALATMIFPV